MTDLDSLMTIFDFGHLQEANWGQSLTKYSKLEVSPVTVKFEFFKVL